MYFGNRRPRGFHYTFRFADERRDILDALRRGVPPEALANRPQLAADTPAGAGGHRRRGRSQALVGWLAAVLLLLVAVLCMLVAV